MIRKGIRVERLTKKVGQVAQTGRVAEVLDEHYVEVEWDDGHTSIVSKDGLIALTEANRPRQNA